jgi:hypothetical protein
MLPDKADPTLGATLNVKGLTINSRQVLWK